MPLALLAQLPVPMPPAAPGTNGGAGYVYAFIVYLLVNWAVTRLIVKPVRDELKTNGGGTTTKDAVVKSVDVSVDTLDVARQILSAVGHFEDMKRQIDALAEAVKPVPKLVETVGGLAEEVKEMRSEIETIKTKLKP